MSDSEEDIFLPQSSFNVSINSGNDLDNLLEDYQNAQFNIEEATEGLFSFNQADKIKKSQSAALTRRLKQVEENVEEGYHRCR